MKIFITLLLFPSALLADQYSMAIRKDSSFGAGSIIILPDGFGIYASGGVVDSLGNPLFTTGTWQISTNQGGSLTNIPLAHIVDAGTAGYSNASAFDLSGAAITAAANATNKLDSDLRAAATLTASVNSTNKLNVDLRAALAQTNILLANVTDAGTAGYSNVSAFDLSGAALNATNKLNTDLRSALAQTNDTTKAALASPTFTGAPLSTTPAVNDNSTKIATTAYVDSKLVVKVTTVNVTNTSTTGAKITALDYTTGTGTFTFQYFIMYANTNAGTGVKFGVNHSGTVTHIVANMRYASTGGAAATGAATQVGASATGNLHESFSCRSLSTTSPNLGPTVSIDAVVSDTLVIIEGVMVVTGTGDIQLYHASEVASTSYVEKDSVLILTKAL